MMDYNNIFNEYDKSLKLKEINKENCCDNLNNYNIQENTIICNKCNNCITNILDSPEWRYYGSEDSKNRDPTRCGMALNILLPDSSVGTIVSNQFSKDKSMFQVKKYQQWTSMTYKERSLYKVFNQITDICNKNNLPQIIINESKSLYKIISDIKISRGNNRTGIIAACIYFACKNCNVSRSTKEISELFNIKVSILTKGCKNFQNILNMSNYENKNRIKVNTIIPENFIERFCNRLSLKNEDIINIKNLEQKIYSLNIINDIRPDSFASGCILLYSNYNKLNITKKQISDISKISEVTINKCLKKIELKKDLIFN